ncbi:MAG TPA: class I SAM-dependent methyltransferase [Lachnospiraceae bacterium]|nr:class I SAM-dependent methyltransferase [Lachnospiraceae bacterium]
MDINDTGLKLRRDDAGLCMEDGGRILRGDFKRLKPRIRQDNLNRELLVKASKIKNLERTPTAVDATAGLGEDAFLLAAAGFSVTLYERDPVIAALLKDALKRAAEDPDLRGVAERMRFIEGDSISALNKMQSPPDLILLDPMFPERQKSALVKKKFQVLHQLEQPCTDETELLDAAVSAGPRKIVIKRPLKGPYLAGRKPDYSLKGKAIRYDCIILQKKGQI